MKQHKSIKLERDLIDKIEALAKKENRSFNNMVESMLMYYLYPPAINITTVDDNWEPIIPPPPFACDHEYAPYNDNGTGGYTARCHKCGHIPSPVIQTFHGGTVKIS